MTEQISANGYTVFADDDAGNWWVMVPNKYQRVASGTIWPPRLAMEAGLAVSKILDRNEVEAA